ncbi:MAG: PKD-like domain-containing protein [Bacteroidota bacterium]
MKDKSFFSSYKRIEKSLTTIRLLLAVFFLAVCITSSSFAQVAITAPSLTVTDCSPFPTNSSTLGNIVITETVATDFAIITGGTLILSAPSNFEFTAAGSASSTGTEISGVSVALTNSTTITLTFTVTGTAVINSISITGIQIRGITAAAGPSTVTRTGGTSVVAGDANGAIHATLTSVLNSITAGTITAAQTVCTGGNPTAFAESGTSGTGSLTYAWKSDADGFGAATLATTATHDVPSGLTTTTTYRRVTTSTLNSVACSANTNDIIVTVNPVIAGNTVAVAQTICSGTSPSALTGSTPTGGSGSYTYLWESSTTSSSTGFATASGTSSGIGYTPGTLTATTWYRRTVISGPCTSNVSTAIEITVNAVIGANTVSAAQTICTGSSPSALTGSTPTGGSGAYTYLWESSTTSSTTGFATASGTSNGIGYTPGVLTATTWYRRTVISGPCTSNVSTAIEITVNAVIAANTVSAAQTICIGSSPSALTGSTPTGGSGSYTYLWESSTTSSTTGFATASGTSNGIGYTPGALTATTWYRRTAISSPCASSVSTAIEITVNSVITTNTIGTAQTICSGTTPSALTGSTPTGGSGVYTYLWESSTTNSTTGFATASGTSSGIAYTPGVLAVTTWYRRTVQSAPCTSNVSTAIEITVNPGITVNTVSSAQTICTGVTPSALSGSTPGGGSGSYTYLWESSTTSSSTGFAAASGTNNGISYTPGALTTTTWFRRSVSSSPCSADLSAAIEITVNSLIAVNAITAAQTICTGNAPSALTGSTPTGGNGLYTYLWESSVTSNTTGFSTASGTSNLISYSPGVLTVTTWFRRTVISGPCASDVSAAVEITVNPVIAANVVSAAQTICSGAIPASLTGSTPTGGDGSYVYLWESSTSSNISGFSTASGASNSNGYSPIALTVTTWYRRTVTSGSCVNVSSAIQITVTPGLANNSVTAAQTICTGTAPSSLTGSMPTGGNGSYSYLWELSTTSNSSGFTTASGTNTGIGYAPGALAATTWYRRVITSGVCSNVSSAVEITLSPVPVATAANSSQTICSGASFSTIVVSTSNNVANTTFTWTRNNGTLTTGSVTGIAGSGTGNIIGTALTNTTAIPITVTFTITPTGPSPTGCQGGTTTAVIIVNPTPALSSSIASQMLCSGSNFNYSPSSATTGALFNWSRAAVTGISNSAGNGTNNINEILTNTTTNPVNVTYVYSISANNCTNPNTYSIVVTVNPTPVLNSTLTAPAICSGSIFSYTPTSSTSGASFVWTRALVTGISNVAGNGTNNVNELLTNTSSNALSVIYVYSVSANSCTNPTSYSVSVSVNPLPLEPDFTPYAATVCSGSQNMSVTLDSIQDNLSFAWSATNANLATLWGGASSSEFNFGTASPAVITLQVTFILTGCSNTHSESITVLPTAAPLPVPISVINSNWLICQLSGSGVSYQWGYDSIPTLEPNIINGAVFQQYHATDYPSSSREYWVIVKEGDCFTKSYLNPQFLGVDQYVHDKTVNLFPNPAKESVTISFSENIAFCQIFEISGRVIKVKQLVYPDKNVVIDTRELNNGIYLVEFETIMHTKFLQKLIIQK